MSSEHPRVLVINGEETIVELIRMNLSARGYDVITVWDKESAMAAVAETEVDLVILDLNDYRTEAIELWQQLGETSTAPIIALGTNPTDEFRAAVQYIGATEYLLKPFGIAELMDSVERNLQG